MDLLGHSPAEWENEARPHQFAAWESGQDDLPTWDDARWIEDAETLDLESVDLFLESWRRFQLCRENYDSRSGEGGGQEYQSWGPLFALMGIEEFIDVTPWDGLRVGTLSPPPATTIDRIRIHDHLWRVGLSQTGLDVAIDGHKLLSSTKPIVLRQLELAEGGIRARIPAGEHSVCITPALGV